jgi:hypothetical protein
VTTVRHVYQGRLTEASLQRALGDPPIAVALIRVPADAIVELMNSLDAAGAVRRYSLAHSDEMTRLVVREAAPISLVVDEAVPVGEFWMEVA